MTKITNTTSYPALHNHREEDGWHHFCTQRMNVQNVMGVLNETDMNFMSSMFPDVICVNREQETDIKSKNSSAECITVTIELD